MTLEEELEQKFTSAEQQSESSATGMDIEEQPQETTAEVDEWLNAPKSYKKEYQEAFKDLPQNWRKHLITREKEIERGFSDFGNKVNGYKYIEDAFNSRQERLKAMGLNNHREYNDYLYQIDDAMQADPLATIKLLADAYGVNVGATEQAADSQLRLQLNQMQQTLNAQQQYIQEQKDYTIQNAIREFVEAKADDGGLKHPYYEDVKLDMGALLKGGLAKDLSEAYNKAIYMNENVREKVIAGQAKAELQAKANEAQKAKLAGFQPKSKITPPEKELSLDEMLERNFDKYNL